MPDKMSNLMKIFVQDEEQNPPPAAAEPALEPSTVDDAPAPGPNGSAAPSPPPLPLPQETPPAQAPSEQPGFAATHLSQAEIAAAQLQQMILGDSAPASPEMNGSPAPQPQPQLQPEPEPELAQAVAAPVPTPSPTPEAAAPAPLSHEDYRSIHEALGSIARGIENLPRGNPSAEPLLRQIGPGGLKFVEQAMQVAEEQSGILPRSFDLDTFRSEGQLLRDLGTLAAELKSLATRVENAEAAIGSDAFARALSVYQAAKLANATADLDRFLT